MKFTINKRLAALVLATAVVSSQFQTVAFATGNINIDNYENQGEESKEIYTNDFSNDEKPNEVGGVITNEDVSIEDEMLKVETKFDNSWDWDNNKHELTFFTESDENMKNGDLISFDILVPTEKLDFEGEIRFKGALKDGSWSWQDGTDGAFTKDKFEDLGNGYSKVTAITRIESELNGLKAVVIQIIGGGTDYSGAIYLDNIKVYQNTSTGDEELPEVTSLKWSFDDSLKECDGWNFAGVWAHQGNPEVSYDKNIGGGSIKLKLDFTNDTEASWSEVKLENKFKEKININEYNVLTYDFIYNPSEMTIGSFKTKLYSEGAIDTYDDIKLENLDDIDGGLKKAKVKVKFASVNKDIDTLTLAIIGVNTNYKGNIYIDNIELSQEKAEDIYVEITEKIKHQIAIDVNSLEVAKDIKLVDEKVSKETASLYSYLKGLSKTDKVIFGHQNDTHHKGGKYEIPGDTSGIKSDALDITGSIAGLVGMDTLSFTGDELDGGVDAAVKVAIQAAQEGGIITLSSHMPNFEIVKNKGLDSEGNYDYSGYTPGVTKGNIVQRIMPGGDLNEVFLGYLDMIADYGVQLEEAGVPVLFRPFHENNGSWFWWGKAFCDEQTYKNLFAYTVEYLRDVKGIHNFLYVYSPGGPFEDEDDYLFRYPGDEFVDVLAFDMYHDNPTENDNWMDVLSETIELVHGLAEKKGKLSAVSEVGMRVGSGGTAQVGNTRRDWYNEVLNVVSGSGMPYFMVWANFDDKENFYVPYRMTETTGHEMINEFINFYNDERSIFAKETGDFLSLNVNVDENPYEYGYILSPISGTRVLEATTISAVVKNLSGDVSFIIKDSSGKEIEKINVKDADENGLYKANLTENMLKKIGETIGSINLVVGENVVSTNKIIFNIGEPQKLANVVDDFESYSGESALLLNEWTTNIGPGCSLNPKLTNKEGNFNGGSYGLEFNYKISNAKTSEGWAGMTTAKNVDWSEYDALQLWVKPDGKGQKLVIQITSNGEDFEMFLPEFASTTKAQLLTLKFEDFVGKNKGEFDPANISSIGIWCNTIPGEDSTGEWTVESTMYFDDIKAVNTANIDYSKPGEDIKPGEDVKPGGDIKPGDGSTGITPDKDDKKTTVTVKPNISSIENKNNNGSSKLPKTGTANSAMAIVTALGALIAGIKLTKRNKK